MKTKGEMEAAVCDKLSAFEQEYMGRGPKGIRAYIVGDILLVRLSMLLSAAEQQLVGAQPAEEGIVLFKKVRSRLIEIARPMMDVVIHTVTGVKVVGLHHDFSVTNSEEFLLFMLTEAPTFRESRMSRGS